MIAHAAQPSKSGGASWQARLFCTTGRIDSSYAYQYSEYWQCISSSRGLLPSFTLLTFSVAVTTYVLLDTSAWLSKHAQW